MKKFIYKILLYVLIVLFFTICINLVYIKRDNSDKDNTMKFQTIPHSIKICNFGSSHGLFSFNYCDVDQIECFNFGLSSQSLSYDKRLFEYYGNNIQKGAVVFIPISYFSLFGKSETTHDDFLNKNKRYYKILPKKMIKEYDIKTDIYVNCFPSLLADPNRIVKTLLVGLENTNNIDWSRKSDSIDINEDAKKACIRHIFSKKLDENGNRIFNYEEFEALEYLIDSCYENGFTPILVTTPYLKEYTDEIKKSDPLFLDSFYGIVYKIVESKNVKYYDYGFDDRFVDKYELFMNSDHLNYDGARKFVNILMDEVVHYKTDGSLIDN